MPAVVVLARVGPGGMPAPAPPRATIASRARRAVNGLGYGYLLQAIADSLVRLIERFTPACSRHSRFASRTLAHVTTPTRPSATRGKAMASKAHQFLQIALEACPPTWPGSASS